MLIFTLLSTITILSITNIFCWLYVYVFALKKTYKAQYIMITSVCLLPWAVPLLTLVWSLACRRPQTCRPSSTMAPPTCRCPGPRSPLSQWISRSPPTQVRQNVKAPKWRCCACSLDKSFFTSHRKPNNSSLRYISQPPGLLGLLRHVTSILLP